jgi:hypothetical protein
MLQKDEACRNDEMVVYHSLLIYIMYQTTSFIITIALLFVSAQSNCVVYINQNQCSQCSLSYYLTTNYSCLACPTGCSQCLSATNCLNCQPTYYNSNSQCISCTLNCFTCTSSIRCTQCQSGFFPNQSQCSPCPSYCVSCSKNG